jgi:predicted HicB family RNase H-like nuclease
MNNMRYNGYTARIDYDDEDGIFVGRLAGIRDIVSFHGETVDELRTHFHEAVDHYLSVCEARGEPPQKPFSGKLMLRLPPTTHAAVASAAAVAGKSINQWVAEVLERAAQ